MSMAIEQQRIASFTTIRPLWPHPISVTAGSSGTGSSSSHKVGSNSSKHSSSSTRTYPTPEQLAAASLYYSPSPDAPDNCTSFVDGTNLADWQPGDDATERLANIKPEHPWILILHSARDAKEHPVDTKTKAGAKKGSKKGKARAADKTVNTTQEAEAQSQYSWPDAKLLPDSKAMIAARKATFGKEWSHDAKRGWSCTSAKLAAAGFHYDPSAEESDNAICAYCKKALAGWEKTDDPIYEHQRRRPECPFFNIKPQEDRQAATEPVLSTESAAAQEASVAPEDEEPREAIPELKQSTPLPREAGSSSATRGDAPATISEADMKTTVGQYLRDKAAQALEEIRVESAARLEQFRKRVFSERDEIEAIITGQRKVARTGGKQDVHHTSSKAVAAERGRDRDAAVFGDELGPAPSTAARSKARPKIPTFSSAGD